MITTYGLDEMSKLCAGSRAIPGWIAIGTGSATVTAADTVLTTESDRNALSTVDSSASKTVTYTADFSSVEISGTTLTEFGLFTLNSGGQLWHKEVIGSVEFDGTSELQIQITHQFT